MLRWSSIWAPWTRRWTAWKCSPPPWWSAAGKLSAAVRLLLNTLVCGLLEDTRISSLIQQNFNLLARKTVERTGHGGEHYIAHSRREYWQMWGAAIGGGFLTVFTAALKLHLVAEHWPPFVEAVLIGTNYAISFLLLQIFGFALATKQPAMTGATLADIIRRNRGDSRRDQITEFGASISRTQLAAALGNILAVSIGAVIFNLLWLRSLPRALCARRSGAEGLSYRCVLWPRQPPLMLRSPGFCSGLPG